MFFVQRLKVLVLGQSLMNLGKIAPPPILSGSLLPSFDLGSSVLQIIEEFKI